MYRENKIEIGNCPNCGKECGACCGSTDWGHNISCCSDKCGIAIGAKLKKNESTLEFKTTMRQCNQLKIRLHELRYKKINAVDPFHEF